MASDNNIIKFTAADIEKYHKGLLSVKEMHDLEKAALDDPFLADALEGYAVAGVNAGADIAELKKRLEEKVVGAKVIPIIPSKKNNYSLLKVAAMLLFIAAAAFSIYQFGFNKKTDSIAKNETVPTTENKISDSSVNVTTDPAPLSTKTDSQELITNETEVAKPGTNISKGTKIESDITTTNRKNNLAGEIKTLSSVEPAPAINEEERKLLVKDAAKNKAVAAAKQETNSNVSKENVLDISRSDDEKAYSPVTTKKRTENQNVRNQATNIFRGRVTDEQNVGIPFANVTNLDENTGTYSDANGYFNLTYPDTVLTVQVRSIGFENNNVQLRNTAPTNKVVLQDDHNSLSEVVVSNQKVNLMARSNNNTMQLEEPEPADGWTYYDNYLLNNLQAPEEFKSKPVATGQVEVSFEVNKNGEPVNFKIEKSLCNSCDKEAIRLIKEGPKWKRKVKNGRTTVTIPF